jgi:hypothetical protein
VAHRDTEGHTPLHWAAYQNHESVARLLISLGADVRSVDDEGLTPMHWASLKVRPFPVCVCVCVCVCCVVCVVCVCVCVRVVAIKAHATLSRRYRVISKWFSF